MNRWLFSFRAMSGSKPFYALATHSADLSDIRQAIPFSPHRCWFPSKLYWRICSCNQRRLPTSQRPENSAISSCSDVCTASDLRSVSGITSNIDAGVFARRHQRILHVSPCTYALLQLYDSKLFACCSQALECSTALQRLWGACILASDRGLTFVAYHPISALFHRDTEKARGRMTSS
jgi:hypothetical protein